MGKASRAVVASLALVIMRDVGVLPGVLPGVLFRGLRFIVATASLLTTLHVLTRIIRFYCRVLPRVRCHPAHSRLSLTPISVPADERRQCFFFSNFRVMWVSTCEKHHRQQRSSAESRRFSNFFLFVFASYFLAAVFIVGGQMPRETVSL